MKLNLMALATVKVELGLAVTTYDTAITAMLPKVSADVRRILNNKFTYMITAEFADTADTISLDVDLPLGTVVYNPNLPDDTYLESYDPDTGLYTLSATPTDTGEYIYKSVNMAQWAAISKMIWYRIGKLETTSVSDKTVTSETWGPISKTYSDREINKRWNYPQAILDDLGVPFVGIV